MPQTHRLSQSVPLTSAQRGRVLRALTDAEASAETGGGLRFPREGGWAWVCPDETGTACRIVSEAPDAEFARELCDFYETRVRNLLAEE